MPTDWVIAAPWAGREDLARELRLSPIVAQVLHNRGIADAAAARAFLKPQLSDLIPPERLPGAREAAERIVRAVRAGEPIVVYGDYDVDGITGVSILWHCLKLAGAEPKFYIPHRLEEGYGINADAIESLAADGAKLIITVDCGVTAIEPARRARELGVELIITDHHQAHRDEAGRVELPDAMIVHPGLEREEFEAYPNPHLSGAGVAFKLAWAIGLALSEGEKVEPAFREFLMEALALAALGTVADVVPLLGENRLIAHDGLLGLPRSRNAGLQALIHSAGLAGKKLGGYDIGFKLGPRLNAIGRMGHARLAVELFTRADEEEAGRIAANLEEQNRARQTLERRIAAEAKQMVVDQGQNADGCRAIVLASEGWHAGVIGIVASRIVEEFGRPTVMIALENGVGQGSARSIRSFALHEAFGHCRDYLLSYGGHAMAAGMRIESARVDGFRAAFQERAGRILTPADLRSRLELDDVVELSQLNEGLVADLAKMEPFGAGNAAPRLACDWLEVVGEPRVVGDRSTHLQLTVSDGRTQCKAIAFGMAKALPRLRDHRRCRAAFRPILSEWKGRRSVEMQVLDLQFPDDPGAKHEICEKNSRGAADYILS